MTMLNLRSFLWKSDTMKKHLLTLLLLCITGLSAYAQQSAFDYRVVEAKIKKHIYSSPDSTKYYIKYALAQKNLPDSIRGTVYNIYGIYYGNLGKTDSSIFHYKKAIGILKNYPGIKTMPLMNIAVAYRNAGDYDASFQSLAEALEISKKQNRKGFEAMVYSNMASNYQFTLQYEKSIDCLLKAIAIIKNEDDKSSLTNLNQKLANIYMKMRNFTFAKDLYTQCLAEFKSRNDNVNHALTLINYAECVIHLEDTANAKRALNEAIEELKIIKNNEHLAVAYSKLATIATAEKQDNTAYKNYSAAYTILLKANSLNVVPVASEFIEYLNKHSKYTEALTIIESTKNAPIFTNINAEDKLRFNVAAAETYKKTNNTEAALSGLTTALELKDTVTQVHNNSDVTELQAKLQKELQHEKSLALNAKNKTLQKEKDIKSKLTLLYVFASVFLIIIVLLFLRSLLLRTRLQKETLKSVHAEKNYMVQLQEIEHDFVNSQQEIIHDKQRELTAWALRLANYQDNINEIIEKCEAGQFADANDIKKDLRSLLRQNDYWKQFETRFNNLHPEFGYSLATRYSNLTKNDVEFCSLLKLNLSNKEIASLLQISHESVITKKYRIKKKMEINNDAEFEKLLLEI